MANLYKNCIVTAANNSKTWYIYDDMCYDGTSTAGKKKFTAAIIEKSGKAWSEREANEYISRIPKISYYDAIDMIRTAGKSLAEAVSFFVV